MRRVFPVLILLSLMLALAGASTALAASKVNPKDIVAIDSGDLLAMVAKDKGKIVVVNIFASWCPPCREEIPGLIKVFNGTSRDELALVGVSVDKEPKALATYMQDLHINYPVYLAKGDFIQKVRVTAVPQLLIYNKKGDLVFNHRGLVDEEDLREAIRQAQ
ncbi:TlpA family protein disulfide reductase [Desulfovibrio sp. OttesenSCG-928-A18]|nr:TlpA family protein disulfide reductase [Desulfovibrio sp. OttesenSCG-928-A18]